MIPNAIEVARAEFELLEDRNIVFGTSKLYSRGDFLSLDDPRAFSEGDFIGRLRALFGPVPGNDYAVRHRATGTLVTAYSAQSGPSYGGRIDFERSDRAAADPVLASLRIDWSAHTNDPPEAKDTLRRREHAFNRRMKDAIAGPIVARAVERLDALLSSVTPADWVTTRYWADDPTVYRVGVRGGRAFEETLRADEAVRVLLEAAEAETDPIHDVDGWDEPNGRVVAYSVRCLQNGHKLEPALLLRVRASWVRWTRLLPRESGIIAQAEEAGRALGFDDSEVRAALPR